MALVWLKGKWVNVDAVEMGYPVDGTFVLRVHYKPSSRQSFKSRKNLFHPVSYLSRTLLDIDNLIPNPIHVIFVNRSETPVLFQRAAIMSSTEFRPTLQCGFMTIIRFLSHPVSKIPSVKKLVSYLGIPHEW